MRTTACGVSGCWLSTRTPSAFSVAAAAFSARLVQRLGVLTRTLHTPPMSVLLLQATGGQLFIATGAEGLLLVAVTSIDVNIGEVRLALLDAAGRLN